MAPKCLEGILSPSTGLAPIFVQSSGEDEPRSVAV